MKCMACNETLNDFEQSRYYGDGSRVELCNVCFSYIKEDIDANANMGLMSDADDIDYRDAEELRYIVDNLDTDEGFYDGYDDRETI